MSAQLTCPQCHSNLKTNKPMPAGLEVTCPKCKAPFKVPAGGIKPKMAAVSASADKIAAGRPGAPSGIQTASARAKQNPDDPASDRGFGIVAVAGGALLLAAVAGVLIWIFYDNSNSGGGIAGNGDGTKPGASATDGLIAPPVIQIEPKGPPPDPRIEEVKPYVERGAKFLRDRVLKPDFADSIPKRQFDWNWNKFDWDRETGEIDVNMPRLGLPEGLGKQTFPGVAALIGLTLLECGTPVDDPAISQIAKIIEEYAGEMNQIYVLSSSLFFLNRLSDGMSRLSQPKELPVKQRKLAQTLALRIIGGQLKSGIWFYSGQMMTPAEEDRLRSALAKRAYQPTQTNHFSISNTQFAMLALWGARNHKVDGQQVEVRETLLRAAGYFNTHQKPDGYWIYSEAEPGLLASSTCAGLISLAIEEVLLNDPGELAKVKAVPPKKTLGSNKRARDLGFEYLSKSIGRKMTDPGAAPIQFKGTIFGADAWGDLYFLWSVERVGVIYGQDKIGKAQKDWYSWGYPIVMKQQKKDGSWNDKHGPLIDSCFALLFLKRANIAKDLSDKFKLLMSSRAPAQPAISQRQRTALG